MNEQYEIKKKLLDDALRDFCNKKGVGSIYPNGFPMAYIDAAMAAMDEFAKHQSVSFNLYLSHNQSEPTREFLEHAYDEFTEQQNKKL